MATKKKTTKRKTSSAASSNKRRTSSTARKPTRRNPAKSAARKTSSAKKKTSRRPRRNPALSGETGEIISFAGAAFGLGLIREPIAQATVRFLPFGAWNAPVLSAGTGLALSWLLNALPFTRRFAKPARILGISTAVLQSAQLLTRNVLGGSAAPPLMQGPRGYGQRGNGLGAIGAVTGTPPQIRPLPAAPPQAQPKQNGMGAVGVVPGRFRR